MPHFEHLDNVPSWRRDGFAIEMGIMPAVRVEDPEKTMMVQLTMPELAIFAFGLTIIERLFPELAMLARRVSSKLEELAEVQDYLSDDSDTPEAE